jgi:hypothetical protein
MLDARTNVVSNAAATTAELLHAYSQLHYNLLILALRLQGALQLLKQL